MIRFIVFFVTVFGLLASCKVGKNFETIEVKTDSTFLHTNDSLIQASEQVAILDSNGLKWWELFKDPVLDSLVSTGLGNNKEALIAIKSIEKASLAFKIQKSEMLPQFDAGAGISRGNYSGFVTNSPNTSWYGAATMNWEIDFWGKYRRLNESAKAEMIGSQYGYQAVQIKLITDIVSTYYELVGFHSSYEISKATLALRDSSLIIIADRFTQGIVPEIDLNQAQIQKAIAQSAIPVYERQIALTENRLSLLLGTSSKTLDDVKLINELEAVPEIPIGIPSELLSRRPDILQAEQFVVSQNAKTGAAQAARYPSISLTGLLGVASNQLTGINTGSLAWNMGAGLVAPLFYFGQNKRRVEEQRVLTEQATLQYEQTVLTAFKEVEDALVEIETYKKEITAREIHVKAALNAQSLSKLRYDKGVTSYLEYLEQQRQAFDAQLRLVDVKKNLYNSYVRLYKALGGGWQTSK